MVMITKRSKLMENKCAEPGKRPIRNFPRSYAFSTFFIQKLISGGIACLNQTVNKIDMFKFEFVFIPINVNNNHWCLGVFGLLLSLIQL